MLAPFIFSVQRFKHHTFYLEKLYKITVTKCINYTIGKFEFTLFTREYRTKKLFLFYRLFLFYIEGNK